MTAYNKKLEEIEHIKNQMGQVFIDLNKCTNLVEFTDFKKECQ